jgi:Zn-finger nucleic acid-binding protein
MDGPYRSGAPGTLPPANCLFCGGEVLETSMGLVCSRCSLPAVPSEPIVGTPACPRCSTPFERRALEPRPAHEATVYVCTACRGCFVRGPDWDTLVGAERAPFEPTGSEPIPTPAPAATFKAVRCPACPREMERVSFAARSAVVIDVCPPHGVWFDAGELAAALSFVDHGPPPEAEGIDRWISNQERILEREVPVVTRAVAHAEAAMRERHFGRDATRGTWLDLLFRPMRPFD